METGSPDHVLTFEQVRDAVADSLCIDPSDIALDSSFVALGASSLDRVQLILDLEEALKVEIPDDDAEKFFSVKDVLSYFAPAARHPAQCPAR